MTRLDPSVVAQAGFRRSRGLAFAVPAPAIAEALARIQAPSAVEQRKDEDWHNARVELRRSTILWTIYFLKFVANVPASVRDQALRLRLGRLPAATLRQIKPVDLPSPAEARERSQALDSPDAARTVWACSNQLDQRLDALRGSPHLPKDAVKSLEELLRAVNRAKSLADNPPSSYQAYSKAFHDQNHAVKELVERLAEQLRAEEAGYVE